MDDTTDNYTPGNDQGKVRVAKLFPGDLDNDGYGDLVLSSASFAADKPQLFMIEHDGTLETDYNNHTIPNHASISQNFPNPFNPETQFSYTLNESGTISLGIYDITGKLIYTVYDGFQRAGNHNVFWTGLDQNKRPVSSGVYFYRLVTQLNTISKKMVLAK